MICQGFCNNCRTPYIIDEEGRGVAVGPYQWHAFQQLKELLCATPILLFPDPKLPYTVVANALGTVVGGVLMQDKGSGLQPLAFLSRQLKPMEQRYNAYERELVIVAYCLQSWWYYLRDVLEV